MPLCRCDYATCWWLRRYFSLAALMLPLCWCWLRCRLFLHLLPMMPFSHFRRWFICHISRDALLMMPLSMSWCWFTLIIWCRRRCFTPLFSMPLRHLRRCFRHWCRFLADFRWHFRHFLMIFTPFRLLMICRFIIISLSILRHHWLFSLIAAAAILLICLPVYISCRAPCHIFCWLSFSRHCWLLYAITCSPFITPLRRHLRLFSLRHFSIARHLPFHFFIVIDIALLAIAAMPACWCFSGFRWYAYACRCRHISWLRHYAWWWAWLRFIDADAADWLIYFLIRYWCWLILFILPRQLPISAITIFTLEVAIIDDYYDAPMIFARLLLSFIFAFSCHLLMITLLMLRHFHFLLTLLFITPLFRCFDAFLFHFFRFRCHFAIFAFADASFWLIFHYVIYFAELLDYYDAVISFCLHAAIITHYADITTLRDTLISLFSCWWLMLMRCLLITPLRHYFAAITPLTPFIFAMMLMIIDVIDYWCRHFDIFFGWCRWLWLCRFSLPCHFSPWHYDYYANIYHFHFLSFISLI